MLKILGNRLLLEPLPKKTHSDGGILLAQAYQDDRSQYRVLALGTGPKIPPEVRVGDCVMTPLTYDYFTFEDGSGRIIANVDQLIAVWEQNPPIEPSSSGA